MVQPLVDAVLAEDVAAGQRYGAIIVIEADGAVGGAGAGQFIFCRKTSKLLQTNK